MQMTAENYLRQYEYAIKKAKRLQEEYEKELIEIDAIRSVSDLDGMPHGTGISKTVEDKAIRLADKLLEWKMAALDALKERQDVFDMIYDIDGLAGEVLYCRYVKLLTLDAIATDLVISVPTVMKYKKLGLQKVQEKLDNSF